MTFEDAPCRGMSAMTIGSLFAGIGGLELGLERAGVGRTVWQVEKDPYCQRVLARHWPDAVRYDDVTTVDWSVVEPVEVLCGGFPCQDISVAGRGAGLAGERSGLWREYVRAIRGVRPRFVVVENVAALLARGLDSVLGDLAACGFDAEWDCIPAAAVGAPHRRDRLFVVAYANGGPHGGLQPVGIGRRGDSARAQDDGKDRRMADAYAMAGQTTSARQGPGATPIGRSPFSRVDPCGSSIERGWWDSEPDVGRVVDGHPSDMDLARLRALGNAVVPQVAEVVGRRLMELAS